MSIQCITDIHNYQTRTGEDFYVSTAPNRYSQMMFSIRDYGKITYPMMLPNQELLNYLYINVGKILITM